MKEMSLFLIFFRESFRGGSILNSTCLQLFFRIKFDPVGEAIRPHGE